VHADALLAHDNRADVGRRGELGQGIERIGQEDFDALTLHDLSDDLADLHGESPGKMNTPHSRAGAA
jgi:hypothetical protein